MRSITIQEVHKVFCKKNSIKYSAKNLKKDLAWNCFAVATVLAGMLKVRGINARAVYGRYTGYSYTGRDWHQHGWVVVDFKEIHDPTRWVFGQEKPSIFVGPVQKHPEYDEGSRRLQDEIGVSKIVKRKKGEKLFAFDWSPPTAQFLKEYVFPPDSVKDVRKLSISECLWLAKFDYFKLSPVIDEVYQGLIDAEHSALIPVDFLGWQKATKKERTKRTFEPPCNFTVVRSMFGNHWVGKTSRAVNGFSVFDDFEVAKNKCRDQLRKQLDNALCDDNDSRVQELECDLDDLEQQTVETTEWEPGER